MPNEQPNDGGLSISAISESDHVHRQSFDRVIQPQLMIDDVSFEDVEDCKFDLNEVSMKN